MRKLFFLLVLASGMLVAQTPNATNTQTFGKFLKLSKVPSGLETDNVLVRGTDGIVKFLPRNSFLNSTQNLDQVLTTGNVTDELMKIRSIEIGNVIPAGSKPKVDGILVGDLNSLYSKIDKEGFTALQADGFKTQINPFEIFMSDDSDGRMLLTPSGLSLGSGYTAEITYEGSLEPHRKLLIPRWDQLDLNERTKNIPILINGKSADDYGNVSLSPITTSFTTNDGKIITVTNGVITSVQ